jgi:hypothetical protein
MARKITVEILDAFGRPIEEVERVIRESDWTVTYKGQRRKVEGGGVLYRIKTHIQWEVDDRQDVVVTFHNLPLNVLVINVPGADVMSKDEVEEHLSDRLSDTYGSTWTAAGPKAASGRRCRGRSWRRR